MWVKFESFCYKAERPTDMHKLNHAINKPTGYVLFINKIQRVETSGRSYACPCTSLGR